MSRPPVYRHCRSSIYVTTNPNIPVEIGTPGESIFIGTPGPTIYGPGGSPPVTDTNGLVLIGGNMTFTPTTITVGLEF